ncbi:hypothetical protein ACLOJK_018505 [Asimina triloba]
MAKEKEESDRDLEGGMEYWSGMYPASRRVQKLAEANAAEESRTHVSVRVLAGGERERDEMASD